MRALSEAIVTRREAGESGLDRAEEEASAGRSKKSCGTVVACETGLRQLGQVVDRRSHESRQCLWKTWPQKTTAIRAQASKHSSQITH